MLKRLYGFRLSLPCWNISAAVLTDDNWIQSTYTRSVKPASNMAKAWQQKIACCVCVCLQEVQYYLNVRNRFQGTVAHACNPSTLESRGSQITWGQEFENSLANIVKPCIYWKKKITGYGDVHLLSQLLRRLKQENCLNQGGGGCGEPKSCHCTPAWATE